MKTISKYILYIGLVLMIVGFEMQIFTSPNLATHEAILLNGFLFFMAGVVLGVYYKMNEIH